MNNFLCKDQEYILDAMSMGCYLKYARPPYISALCTSGGGHHRNVSNTTIQSLIRKKAIRKIGGNKSSIKDPAIFKLSEKEQKIREAIFQL